MSEVKKPEYHFFLGGADGEMRRIREVFEQTGQRFSDANLGWGAKTSDYGNEITEVAAQGFTPVILELEKDSDLPEEVIDIDHHGDRSGESAPLERVLDLIGAEKTRFDELVIANDQGHIAGMREMGATDQEIAEVRAYERKAQGITTEQEKSAVEALANKEVVEFDDGSTLFVVKCDHSKTAPITDALALKGEQERENVLILSGDGEVNYYGHGDVIDELQSKYKDGWSGGGGKGDPDGNGFFGGYMDHDEVRDIIRHRLSVKAERDAALSPDSRIIERT